ncbi:hypothetical protein [Streptomyces umbrinus]|uniref:hypothetical protein n=1 Tax=Streptomyces umbrinus TaxID=67370 RepID=UPI003C2ED26B
MMHDAVLPGARIEGEPCPDCSRELPWRARGFSLLTLGGAGLDDAYDAAAANRPQALLDHLTSEKHDVPHKSVWENGIQRPCRFRHLPSWLLAQCQTPKEVDAWVEKLRPWWTPPAAPDGS